MLLLHNYDTIKQMCIYGKILQGTSYFLREQFKDLLLCKADYSIQVPIQIL